MNVGERIEKARRELSAVSIAMRDPRTPLSARLLAGLAVGYALSPVDLIPDFIPVLGWLEDAVILPGLIALSVRRIPPEVWEESRREAGKRREAGGAKKWYCAVPVVLVWLLVCLLIVRAVRLR